MACSESLYNYINRQIKKISEKQHNFIELQDRVNTNIFVKLDEINGKLLDIGQANNDELKKEIEKLASQINEVKGIISQNTTENTAMFTVINNSILELQNKDKSQDTEIVNIKGKNSTQDTEITSIKEKNSSQDTLINTIYNQTNKNITEITKLKTKTDNTNTALETYKANTDVKIDNINNVLNSVVSHELVVNTGTEVNVKQDIFQNKVCSIAGFFKSSHMQSGWSSLIQLKKPYPKHDVQFVCFDATGKKPIQGYINNVGVINFNINYSGEKAIYFNVSYIA